MPDNTSWRWGSPSHAIAAVKKLNGTPRKCRLHCVACCRLLAKHIKHPDCLALVTLLEAFADDELQGPAVAKLRRKVSQWARAIHPASRSEADWAARWSAWAASDPKAVAPVTGFVQPMAFRDVLAEVYGPRTGSVSVDPEWLTSTVLALARQMYESRDFSAMPILADALQDAGCENADVLDHCQGSGPHVRGCWVIDLLLNRA